MPKRNQAIKPYKLKDGSERWGFRIYLGVNPNTGKKSNTTKTGFITYQQANAEYTSIAYQVSNGLWEWPSDKAKTFREIYQSWYKSYRHRVKPSTLAKTEDIFNLHILPAFGQIKIDQINAQDCQKIVDQWSIEYVKYKTFCNYTSDIFKQAIRSEQITENPMDMIIIPSHGKISKRPLDNFLSMSELKLFMNFVKDNKKPEIYTFFRLLAFSGMRKGEALALRWSDIDLDHNIIDINKTVAKQHNKVMINPPKWNSYRKIDVDPKTLDVLKSWKQLHPRVSNKSLVFPNRDGKPRQLLDPNIWLDKIVEQMNRNRTEPIIHRITPHGFRHTHATLLFESDPNIKPKEVQERLGHKDISITMNIYTHVTDHERKQISNSLAKHIDF